MYSQTNEDEIIVKALDWKTDGRFLDIGAWRSKKLSNSRLLWEYGWNGVMVECSPGPMRKLLKSYGGNPRIKLVQAAVGGQRGILPFYITDEAVSTSEQSHYDKWRATAEFRGAIWVPTITLEMLAFHFGSDFDFVNIDTEGTSVDLFLRMLELHWQPQCVCVEHDGRTGEIEAATKGIYNIIHQNTENMILMHVDSSPTLVEIYALYGGASDKGTRHSYLEFYDELFAPYRDKPINLLEIGMGGGDCLMAWQHYFLKGTVAGLDLWTGQEIGDIRKVHGDATSSEVWEKNFAGELFDIIIDDASHKPEDQVATFNLYKQSLKADGVFVIEDIVNIEVANTLESLGFEVFDRRAIKDVSDDILAVWRSPT